MEAHCHFCGLGRDQVELLVTTDSGRNRPVICDSCALDVVALIQEHQKKVTALPRNRTLVLI
jgi:hypothetical protein